MDLPTICEECGNDEVCEGYRYCSECLEQLGHLADTGDAVDMTPTGPESLIPYHQDDEVTLYHGDCLTVLRSLPDNSVDSVVTDPPYGLEFMGKDWDAPWKSTEGKVLAKGADGGGFEDAPGKGNPYNRSRVVYGRTAKAPGSAFQDWCELWATECYRVLKPGGHILAFGGTRMWHRLASAIEDSGFEIRDSIAWLYGSGFPKSRDIAKDFDKRAGHWRGKSGAVISGNSSMAGENRERTAKGEAITDDAKTWEGWGTALKPAFEPIVVGRKPLTQTVADNVLQYGTGALNIDGCRVPMTAEDRDRIDNMGGFGKPEGHVPNEVYSPRAGSQAKAHDAGRWPTNVLLDDTQAAELDRQSGVNMPRGHTPARRAPATGDKVIGLGHTGQAEVVESFAETGGASRFFPTFRYEAKAPKVERPRDGEVAHPTVKPVDLMRWMVRLVTPKGGVVLDPFAGSGTTAEACIVEGFRCVTIEREPTYLPLIVKRVTKEIEPVLDFG